MFLFVHDARAVVLRKSSQPPFLTAKLQTYRHGASELYWTQDPFTRVMQTRERIAIVVGRPKIDSKPILRLTWNPSVGSLGLDRRWSGEFTAYVIQRPTWIVASHLRFLGWFCNGVPPGCRSLLPDSSFRLTRNGYGTFRHHGNGGANRSSSRLDYEETVERVRTLVSRRVADSADPAALLLSGGVDSSVIAAVAGLGRKSVRTFTFGLRRPFRRQKAEESDLINARKVAQLTQLPHEEILLDRRRLLRNVPAAIALAETCRGTIVDDCVALIEVAKVMVQRGFTTVWMGEGADDLFGGFKFALRYYRGRQLIKYFRHELDVSLPDELCILQKIFEPWGISVVHPFWTAELKAIGYHLPLKYRVDAKRLMKRILRDAFSDILPLEICMRPKGVTRDTTQIRWVLEAQYGTSRDRYRGIFRSIFRDGFEWPRNKKN